MLKSYHQRNQGAKIMLIESVVDEYIEKLCLFFLEPEERKEKITCPECYERFVLEEGYIHGDSAFCSASCLRYALD